MSLRASNSPLSNSNTDQPLVPKRTWNARDWQKYFRSIDKDTNLRMMPLHFRPFSQKNPEAAKEILSELDLTDKTPSQRNILQFWQKKLGVSVKKSQEEPVEAVGRVEPSVNGAVFDNGALHEAVPVVENTLVLDQAVSWKYPQWKEYFSRTNEIDPKLRTAATKFRLFAKNHPSVASGLLKKLKLKDFENTEAKRIIRILRNQGINKIYDREIPEKQSRKKAKSVESSKKPESVTVNLNEISHPDIIGSTGVPAAKIELPKAAPEVPKPESKAIRRQVVRPVQINDSVTIVQAPTPVKVVQGPPALDTSNWGETQWRGYLGELEPSDGIETLKTFGNIARNNLDFARRVLKAPKYRNRASREQIAIMDTLYDRHVKPKLSKEEPTTAQLLARVSQIDSSKVSNYVRPAAPTDDVEQIDKWALNDWEYFFSKAAEHEYTDKVLLALKKFRKRNPTQTNEAASRIKGLAKFKPETILGIREALGKTKKAPKMITTPKSQRSHTPLLVSETRQSVQETRPDGDLARSPSSLTSRSSLAPRYLIERPKEPPRGTTLEELKDPESSLTEAAQGLLEDLELELGKAEGMKMDVDFGSPFAKAKKEEISRILFESQETLAQLSSTLTGIKSRNDLSDYDVVRLQGLVKSYDALSKSKYLGAEELKAVKKVLDTFKKEVSRLAPFQKTRKVKVQSQVSEKEAPEKVKVSNKPEEPEKNETELSLKGLRALLESALRNNTSGRRETVRKEVLEVLNEVLGFSENDELFVHLDADGQKKLIDLFLETKEAFADGSFLDIVGDLTDEYRETFEAHMDTLSDAFAQKAEELDYSSREQLTKILKYSREA